MFFGRAISGTSKSVSYLWTKLDNVCFRPVLFNRYLLYSRNRTNCLKSPFSYLAITDRMASTSTQGASSKDHRNRLGKERSPYLLQHASNPVDWYPWGEEAFAKARAEDKLIFLSVGYSTCHWCHVMERESFEDVSTASIMNEYFVNVKVDREERPDVDRTYMTFVQVSSGSGGWPMSVFITPDLKPVAGGTYFPPEDGFGRPSFKTVLLNIAKQWMDQRSKVISTSVKITDLLRETAAFDVGVAGALLSGETPGKEVWELCLKQLEQGYQHRWGGFSPAPKFPQPTNLNFLFNLAATDKGSAESAKRMALKTLDKMALGGINDHISLGFARYSTDEKWHVPHFEKMLYDQAQLAVAYTNAFLISKDEKYAKIVRDILTYVTRDLSHPEGGFFSAEDADSYPTSDSSHKKEGAFCVWTYDEVCSLLDQPVTPNSKVKLADIFCQYYNVKPGGNVNPEQDPHNELKNQNVLIILVKEEEISEKFGISVDDLRSGLKKSREILYNARQKRPRPHLDDKIVTAWNGLMISGFAKGAFALKDDTFKERAIKAAEFIKNHLYTKKKRLLRSCYTQGTSVVQIDKPIEGFLDDYAFLIRGLLDLYECTMDQSWLEWALELQHTQDDLFWDHGLAGYFATSSSDNSLLFRLKDDQDGAEPCGNSVSAGNLLKLGAITDDHDMHSKASNIFASFSNRLARFPLALPEMTSALMVFHHSPTLVVLTGDVNNADTQALLDIVRERYIPGLVLMVSNRDLNSLICSKNHSVAKMKKVGERQAAYVCRGHTCSLPVTTPADLAALIS